MQNIPVKSWGLCTATENALLSAGLYNYVDFIKMCLATNRPLKRIPGIGWSRTWEIEGRLDDLGLRRVLTTEEKLVLLFAEPRKRPQLAVDLIAKNQNGKDQLALLEKAFNQLSECEKAAILEKFSRRIVTAMKLDCSVRQVQKLERSAVRKIRNLMESPEEESVFIEMLNLSTRAYNVLKRNDIDTVADIMSADFAEMYGMGACTEREVIASIARLGYHKEPVLSY